MLWFTKLAAASSGRQIRAYFTEQSPDQGAQASADRDASSGAKLAAYYTGRDSRAAWSADMPFADDHRLERPEKQHEAGSLLMVEQPAEPEHDCSLVLSQDVDTL